MTTISQETFDRLYATYQYNGGSIATELLIKEGIGEHWYEFDKKAQAKYNQELKDFAATITSTNKDIIYQEIAKTDYRYCTSQNKSKIVEYVLENNKPAPVKAPVVKQQTKTNYQPKIDYQFVDRVWNRITVCGYIATFAFIPMVIFGGMSLSHNIASSGVNPSTPNHTEVQTSTAIGSSAFILIVLCLFIARVSATKEYRTQLELIRVQESKYAQPYDRTSMNDFLLTIMCVSGAVI